MDFKKNSHLFEPFISILGGKNVLVLTDREALFNVAYYFDRSTTLALCVSNLCLVFNSFILILHF